MQLRRMKSRLLYLLVLVLLLSISGCAALTQEPDRLPETWVDVAAAKEQITKAKELSAVIDEAEPVDKVEKEPGAKMKDLSVKESPPNPYLQKLAAPPTADSKVAAEGEGVLLNFDNADIYEVIQVISEILDLNYIIDPAVKGVVNIRSGKKIPKNQLFSIFKKILNINGLDIRQEGGYSFISLAEKPMAQSFLGPDAIKDLDGSAKVIMQVVPISYMASGEAITLIEPYLSKQGSAFNLDAQNTLILLDYEANVLAALNVLANIDISPLTSLKVRLIRVDKAPLFTLRDELMEILTTMGVNKNDHQGVSVLPLERVNSLLIMSNNEFLLNNTVKWVEELDNVPLEGRDNIYIYNVRNSVASELAELVNNVINGDSTAATGKAKSKTSREKSATTAAGQRTTAAARKPAPKKIPSKLGTASESKSTLRFAGEPLLLPDDGRNVILIRALPADYSRIMKLLERLDNLPRQVLIEVIVAEVTLSDSWEMGIEWTLHNQDLKINESNYEQEWRTGFDGVSQVSGSISGFSYSVIDSAGEIAGLFSTIASDNDISILSSPQVMVLNNESATVNVGQEVPISTSESINTDTGGQDTRTIQYRDTGVILTVTPRINYNGIIILDIEQEVSEAQEAGQTSGIDSPTIFNRLLKTKLAVKDGQSILMGGLIDKSVDKGTSGVPILMDIPILGWLFKFHKETTDRTELMMVITPYVIESENVLAQYVDQFQKKISEIRKDLAKRPE